MTIHFARRAVLAVVTALLTSLLAVPHASAGMSVLCVGYDACQDAGRSNYGYKGNSGNAYWNMATGHNCTNYVAYRLIKNGAPAARPAALRPGDGDAYFWGGSFGYTQNPVAGAVAWWDRGGTTHTTYGHVAIVEKVVSDDEIIISEDNYGGNFYWKRLTKGDAQWPNGFIHNTGHAAMGAYDGINSDGKSLIQIWGWGMDLDVPKKKIDMMVFIGGPAGTSGAEVYAISADGSRPDVGAAYPGVGDNHGFNWLVATNKRGWVPVYVYAINYAGTVGANTLLGYKLVWLYTVF